MEKIKLVFEIPDKNSCNECLFLSYYSYETGYQNYNEGYKCRIFNCEITNKKRCVACQSCQCE